MTVIHSSKILSPIASSEQASTLRNAIADFRTGSEREGSRPNTKFMYGSLCVYEFRNSVVFGRRQIVVTRIWWASDDR